MPGKAVKVSNYLKIPFASKGLADGDIQFQFHGPIAADHLI